MVQVATAILNRSLSSFHTQIEQKIEQALSRLTLTAESAPHAVSTDAGDIADDEGEDDEPMTLRQRKLPKRRTPTEIAFHVRKPIFWLWCLTQSFVGGFEGLST